MSSSDGCIIVQNELGEDIVFYAPQPHQMIFHESNAPNLLALGTRGTGKSVQLRMDAHLRCLLIPHFKALIIRRTMPELRRSHLGFIDREMKQLGGVFLHTTNTAKYPNGSTLVFAHCETEADVMNFLSSEYGFIGFDELSTFTLEQFLKICAAARAPLGADGHASYNAVIRCSSNPLGVGADWMYAWFVDHDVRLEDYPDYIAEDFEMQFSTLEDNRYLDQKAYAARLKNLPEHVRRAWLLGERVTEGTYFLDFHKSTDEGKPWHVLTTMPMYEKEPIFQHSWINVYRCIDWGFWPDPAVCIWIAVLPNKRAIAFKERTWHRTLAGDVAKQIKADSKGMHVVESFCDPTMNIKEGQDYSIGEIFEMNGVPVTAATNDRMLYGYSVHEYLNTLIDETPQLQIVQGMGAFGCPNLIRTFPQLRRDENDPRKLADGEDHWVVAVSYFCMGRALPAKNPEKSDVPKWMRPKQRPRSYGVAA